MGKGGYFLGIARSIYRNVFVGIKNFSDEFGSSLKEPSAGIKIKPYVRQVFVNPQHEIKEGRVRVVIPERSEEHTSELQSLMRTSYAVFCLTKKKIKTKK